MSLHEKLAQRRRAALDLFLNSDARLGIMRMEQALQFATMHEMRDEVPAVLVDLARMCRHADQNRRAAAFLLRLHDDYKKDLTHRLTLESQVEAFYLIYDLSPNLGNMLFRLEAFERLAGEQFQATFLRMRATLYSARGLNEQSLADLEAVWFYRGTSESCETCMLADIVQIALEVDGVEQAQPWYDLMNRQSTRTACQSRLHSTRCRFTFASRDERGFFESVARLRDVDAGNSLPHERERATQWYVSEALLKHSQIDPYAPHHPGLRILLRPERWERDVHQVYHRAALVARYRLAALRFACGIHPLGSEWNTTHNQHKSVLASDELLRRYRCLKSAVRAMRLRAQRLDEALECTWRTEAAADLEREGAGALAEASSR